MSEVEKSAEVSDSAEAGANKSIPAGAAGAATADAPARPRLGIFGLAKETMAHIERAEKDKSIVFRPNDKRSTLFLIAGMALLMILTGLVLAMPDMRTMCIILAVVADLFLAMAIFWYVLLRFGTIRTLEPRHALLCWQLMLGTGILFAFYAMNVTLACFTLFANRPQ